ncbi:3127_t:CDS:2, partial [Acaulospora morrowiae]
MSIQPLIKRARTAISDSFKNTICQYSLTNPNQTHQQIAEYFNNQDVKINLDRSTVSKILKNKDRWLAVVENQAVAEIFRHRKVKYPLLDKSMQLWIEQVIQGEMFLTKTMIKEKASYFIQALSLPNDALKLSNSKGKRGTNRGSVYRIPDLSNQRLTNIKVEFLPPNTTAHLQLMDAGIIKSFKAKYQEKYIRRILNQFENGEDIQKNKINIKEAINYVAESWDEVTELTIMNCWKKTGILPLVSNDKVEFDENIHQESSRQEECQIGELLSDFTSKETNPTIIQEIQRYVTITNANIPTEEPLNDAQIVEIVLAEQLEDEQGDPDNSDEELCNILPSNALLGLKKFYH